MDVRVPVHERCGRVVDQLLVEDHRYAAGGEEIHGEREQGHREQQAPRPLRNVDAVERLRRGRHWQIITPEVAGRMRRRMGPASATYEPGFRVSTNDRARPGGT